MVGGHGGVNWSLKTGCRGGETGNHIGSPLSQLNFGLDKQSQEVVKGRRGQGKVTEGLEGRGGFGGFKLNVF